MTDLYDQLIEVCSELNQLEQDPDHFQSRGSWEYDDEEIVYMSDLYAELLDRYYSLISAIRAEKKAIKFIKVNYQSNQLQHV